MIWVTLGQNQSALEKLASLHSREEVTVILSAQNEAELLDESNSPFDLETNRKTLIHFKSTPIADKIFVLGSSRLGLAELGDESAESTYRKHQLNKKSSLNHWRDGIHLANAQNSGCVIVTCDRQIISSARESDVERLCLNDFGAKLGLDLIFSCTGCPAKA